MEAENLKKGNQIQSQLEDLRNLLKNYSSILESEDSIRKDYQSISFSNKDIRIIISEKDLPELNEIFQDELKRFLQIMKFRIEDQIKKKELEFTNL